MSPAWTQLMWIAQGLIDVCAGALLLWLAIIISARERQRPPR